jgi:endonuclease G
MTGYLLDQTPLLHLADTTTARGADDPPPLGPFRTFRIPIADLQNSTRAGPAQPADCRSTAIGSASASTDAAPARWVAAEQAHHHRLTGLTGWHPLQPSV